jgi:hypothetical protein
MPTAATSLSLPPSVNGVFSKCMPFFPQPVPSPGYAPPPEKMYEVDLLFYIPQPDDHYINHIVAKLSGPFSHVEIGFRTFSHIHVNAMGVASTSECLYGSSIFQGGEVFFKPKSYSRDGYTSLGLKLNKRQHDALLAYCQHSATMGIKFDAGAMVRASFPIVLFPDSPNKTFCSKYVTDALKYAGIPEMASLDSRTTTPSSLFNHIKTAMKSYTIVSATPHKLNTLKSAHKTTPV